MYRSNAADEPAPPPSAPRRIRPIFIAVLSVGLHAALFGAAFASRPKQPTRPATTTVRVLAGQVDPWTGDFHASGMRLARIKS